MRAVEFDVLRRLAPDFVTRLNQVGLINLMVPADVGGYGASLTEGFKVLMTLAAADASMVPVGIRRPLRPFSMSLELRQPTVKSRRHVQPLSPLM